jgi:Type VI secretion system/phage-baseplate injector OB domain
MGMENYQRSTGTPSNFDENRGGLPGTGGPYIGIVKNNLDDTRMGRLQVYITAFGGNPDDDNTWKWVNYCTPFYGATPKGGSAGTGTFLDGNQQSYGMWFTPPDIGVQVMVIFTTDDPGNGYYIGCLPTNGITHMIPAIGSVENANAQTQNAVQGEYLKSSPRLPVTEINNSSENPKTNESPTYFNEKKPVHSYVAGILFQQGLNNDTVRGPIASSAQRESPSNCYGISTPGRAIYQGGLGDTDNAQTLDATSLANINVIGRRGGHSFVMDDGALNGSDNLIRIRTSKGHQITMSDDGNCFYICHANGQTWVELGQEGTLDVYSTNSINMRTEGTINLHADKDVNIYAGGSMNLKSKTSTSVQSDGDADVASKGKLSLYGKSSMAIKSGGTLAIKSTLGSWSAGASLSLSGTLLLLNSGPGLPASTPKGITKYLQPNTEFNASTGWQVSPTGTESIVTRAPTHEPYPYHNQGVDNQTSIVQAGQPTPPPDAPNLPDGVTITKIS